MRTIFVKSIAAAAALVAAGSALAADPVPVPGMGTWESTLQARDLNTDGIADAYYDTVLGISWLATTDLIGRVTFDEATQWVSRLNVLGVTGWTLPTIRITSCTTGYGEHFWNGEASQYAGAGVGGGVCGYNVQTDTSDMAHMFSVTLGNQSISGIDAGTLQNSGPFVNLRPDGYWFSQGYSLNGDGSQNTAQGWRFSFHAGRQDPLEKDYLLNAWAIHQGDVGVLAAVPEPETYSMMLAGLGAMAFVARRRRRNNGN